MLTNRFYLNKTNKLCYFGIFYYKYYIMTGGLMQLVAYGAQDIYLTGNPMITYFKVVYRRHTNFAMESIQQTFNGTPAFNNRVTALISRNGDLVSGMMMEIVLPNLDETGAGAGNARYHHDVGHHLLKQVEIEIGGQLIDRHYGDWFEIWAQLTVPASKELGYRWMIGQDLRAANSNDTGLQLEGAAVTGRKIYVPLQFWFCRNIGLALPLIALQYHEVKVNIQFAAQGDVLVGTPATTNLTASLWVDYVYLDTDERRRFAQVSHEYLIEQLQLNSEAYPTSGAANTISKTVDLNFNHPVKELVWVCKDTINGQVLQSSRYILGNEAMGARDNFTGASMEGSNPVNNAILQLNGHDRFAQRDGAYFNKVQPYQAHTRIPASPGINVYSFALKPEEHQPSGTCNFSRIDNVKLRLTLGNVEGGNILVFATNYNVLRVMSGMGGLAYSN
jgi:hypothetical protein